MSLFPDPAPGTSMLHAHCDGGSRGNPGPAGFGAVITDERGRMLAELSDFLGIRTNNFAEYSGLLAVLEWTLAHGYRRLQVVSDSLLMVQQIKGRYKVNSPDLKPLWQEAKNRIAKLESFEISHALRHKNKEADALANAAMDRGMKRGTNQSADRGAAGSPAPTLVQAHVTASKKQPDPAPAAATPYPVRSAAPPDPFAANRAPASGAMHRGFTRDGVVHLLGGVALPDGLFVKVVME